MLRFIYNLEYYRVDLQNFQTKYDIATKMSFVTILVISYGCSCTKEQKTLK